MYCKRPIWNVLTFSELLSTHVTSSENHGHGQCRILSETDRGYPTMVNLSIKSISMEKNYVHSFNVQCIFNRFDYSDCILTICFIWMSYTYICLYLFFYILFSCLYQEYICNDALSYIFVCTSDNLFLFLFFIYIPLVSTIFGCSETE